MNMIRKNDFLRAVCIAMAVTGFASSAPIPVLAEDQPAVADQSTDQGDPGIFAFESEEEPPVFDDPDPAVEMLKSDLAANDFDGVAKLLGLDPAKLRSADGVMDTFQQIRDGAAKQIVVVAETDDRRILNIGEKLWPFPFPLLKGDDGKWAFDTEAGLEEIVNRRIGENELQAIATMREYVDAQEDYSSEDRDGDGVEEFAQKLISSEGTTDGLYWPPDQGDGESPAGNLDKAELEDARKGEGYFGYRFRILTGQGDRIAGGAYDYIINGNMIAGFGLIAWPAKYAETGVNTFMVNQQGIVYQADLGPATADIVKYIDRFNPDDSWSVADD